jgi:hypothetical protein
VPALPALAEPLASIVRQVAGARRARWDVARLEAGYCARAPRDVQGEVPFTAPCADLSGVTACALSAAGLRPTLVLGGIARALRPVKFQCGLEVDQGGQTWVVGFGVSTTYLYPGRFVETRRRPWVFRVAPDRLDDAVPFLAWFEEGGRTNLARRIPGYDLARDVAWHAARHGALRWWWARRQALGRADGARPERLADAAGRWE